MNVNNVDTYEAFLYKHVSLAALSNGKPTPHEFPGVPSSLPFDWTPFHIDHKRNLSPLNGLRDGLETTADLEIALHNPQIGKPKPR